jgi:hypothetical protein
MSMVLKLLMQELLVLAEKELIACEPEIAEEICKEIDVLSAKLKALVESKLNGK